MKIKLLLSALLGMAAWSFSSTAAADWDTGACPQPHTGPAPCIETVVNGNTYHFNGSGDHADEWHGLPGGGAFDFQNTGVDLDCPGIGVSCDLTLSGEVKKCEDSNGNWRIGVRVTGADVTGSFLCDALSISGFPWYSADPANHSHPNECPFVDDCDNFLPYNPTASNYVGHFGEVTVSSLLGTHVAAEHLHGVTFTANNMGATPTANFNFAGKTFFSCDGEEDCSIDGILYLDNAAELNIY
ncbi:hypothetical protein Y5W_02994 [Alcanivorax sp. 521-1]|uniref:Uncharacterized protein n=1 Tax=Alloalcanivorax profundimaris TaxID=2735259 RepID=A0ABS0AWM6_9GAMM|nr:hypothetical protein [Alloalcanivorax profundimaris]MBF5057700.1 hypothetical protein [Alloalcanivorax profundimaris]